jgi:hypothetical protein
MEKYVRGLDVVGVALIQTIICCLHIAGYTSHCHGQPGFHAQQVYSVEAVMGQGIVLCARGQGNYIQVPDLKGDAIIAGVQVGAGFAGDGSASYQDEVTFLSTVRS